MGNAALLVDSLGSLGGGSSSVGSNHSPIIEDTATMTKPGHSAGSPRSRTKEDFEQNYPRALAEFRSDPTQSIPAIARKYGMSDSHLAIILNRTGAIYDALTESKRKEMGREFRLSFFRIQQLEQELTDAGQLNARDLRDLAVAKGITAQHINLIEGMPTAIEVNVDIYREKFAQIAYRMIEGAKMAGMLPEGGDGDTRSTPLDPVVEDRAVPPPPKTDDGTVL